MEIKNINLLNLDTLYNIVVEKYYDINFRNVKYGRNFQQILNHIVITLELDSVSQYEYIFLKMYCSNVTKLTNQEFNLKTVETNFKDINENIIRLLSFISSISENNKNHIDYDSYLSPSGIITGHCCVTLTGPNLANLFTLDPINFFIIATDKECLLANEDESDNTNKPDPNYKDKIYNNEKINNYIISEFLHGFYRFMSERITFVDYMCDSFNFSKFLSLAPTNGMSVFSLRNPYFMCDFIEDDSSTIVNNMKIYKELDLPQEFTINNTEFEICINNVFGVFFEFMNLLPYSKFVSFESFNNPSLKSLYKDYIPNCPEDLKENFDNRFRERTSNLVSDINKNYSADVIKRSELTQNYINYSFIIKLSLSDIDNYLNKYTIENKDSNDYIVKRTVSVIKTVIMFIMSMYKLMK